MDEMIECATPSARELRRSARLATNGCQKELMTLSVTMKKPWKVNKKPGKVHKVSASTEEKHSSASTEKHFDSDSNSGNITDANNSLGYAQSGLKLYQKINEWEDTLFDFESIEILLIKKLRLFQLGSNCTEFWKHVCFTAKPGNGDASPKYFLVEVKKGPEGRWKARRCWMFEPKDDAGMDHGCIICTNDQEIHPVAGQYYAGHTLTCRDATRGCQKELMTPREQSSTCNEKHFYTDSITKLLKNY